MQLMAKERCCCGCSISLGSRILAAVSGMTSLIAIFMAFFSFADWLLMLAEILYCFASVCAASLVFRAIRSRRAILMAPIMLTSVINFIGLVVAFTVCILTSFGVKTSIYNEIEWLYVNSGSFAQMIDKMGTNTEQILKAYAQMYGGFGASFAFIVGIFAIWVFIVHFSCFRTLKEAEGNYPTAQYHGDDNITVPIYPTYPLPAYEVATEASDVSTVDPAPAYPGTPYDIPPSYTNEAVTTADETPVKVPLP